jgi:hypothetical protein
MNELDVSEQTLSEIEQLFNNFNEYANGRSLRDMVTAGAPLVAATVTVERARNSNDVTDVLHAIAFGVYLAEIGKAHLMLTQATMQ